MNKINKSVTILVVLVLVFSLLPLGNVGFVVARDNDSEDGVKDEEIKTNIIKELRDEYVADEVVVKYKGNTKPQVTKLSIGKSVRDSVREFEFRGDVEYAEPNYIAHAFLVPNDSYYSLQWHLNNSTNGGINTESAWNLSQGSGVTVAVIDTGIAYENYTTSNGKKYYKAPDLASTCFVPGYDFIENDTHPNDDNSHGTHVAGTIAQSTNNGLGTAGVAFSSCLMPVKALNTNGSGTYTQIADAIRYAADNGAKVVNLSLGGSASSQVLLDAVAYAYGKGVTIIAAAGNDGVSTISYPAAYNDYVVAVGATRFDETLAPYSNYGTGLDLVAPGGDLSVDQNGDGYGDGVLQNTFNPTTKNRNSFGYWFFQGTSMATPHVAGVAALVISNGNATTVTDVRKALEETADNLGTAGWDGTYGWGLVNAQAALAWVSPTPTPVPTPTPTPDPTPTPTPTPTPPVEIEVFFDSFEVSEWNGLWTEDSQNDWFRSSQRAVDGSRSAEVDGSANNAKLISIPINLQGKNNVLVTFSWLIESGLDSGEYLAFDVSTDGGSTWIEKAKLSGNIDPENVWRNVSVNLSGINNLSLRFRGKMSQSDEDANVDFVRVMAN